MKTVAIVQARTTSKRLPGKVLKPLGDKTVLGNVITRLQRCKNLDNIIVACPYGDADIVQEAIRYGAQYFTGSEDDVLERYYKCAKFYGIDRIVRITADCPYIMPDIVDKLIQESKLSYGSNVINRTYPKGLDCEVFDYEELERAYKHAEDREHVTTYIIKHAMAKYSLEDNEDYNELRLTVDWNFDYLNLSRSYDIIGEIYDYSTLKTKLSSLFFVYED